MKYFAKIKYLGTKFCGFQVQPNARTVQGELCRALNETFCAPCKVTGCSRTDSGVHANEFSVTIETEQGNIPAKKLPVAAARYLPEDISLYYAEECADEFHPRYNVISKEYLYRIRNTEVRDPFDVHRAWFISRPIDESAIRLMNEAATYIVGKQDFAAFMSEGSDVKDTVRTVFYLEISKKSDIVEIKICADGFLYNMVRIIVGTLIDVAFGKTTPEDVKKIILSKDRSFAGITAPPDGLFLNRVNY